MQKIYLGLPCYGHQVHTGIMNAVIQARADIYKFAPLSHSLLPYCFNMLYAKALNLRETEGITHFMMLHGDVVPQDPTWVKQMLDTMELTGADIVGTVIPIKDSRGLTSTAWDEPVGDQDQAYRVRRITMREAFKDGQGRIFQEPNILVNTGLMLVDIRKPFADQICFGFKDIIRRDRKTNEFTAYNVPEDWLFSRRARALGAKLVATSLVRTIHIGTAGYENSSAWGTLERDE